MCFIPQYKKAYPSLSLLNLAVFKQFERAKITSGKAAINLRERQLLRFRRWFVRPRRFVHFKLRMLKKKYFNRQATQARILTIMVIYGRSS